MCSKEYHNTIPKFAAWKNIKYSYKISKPCRHTIYYKIHDLKLKDPKFYSNCVHNQKLALECRYFKENPEYRPNKKILKECVDELISELKEIKTSLEPLNLTDFLSDYTSSMYKRYYDAIHKSRISVSNKIEIFIKDEFYMDHSKPPRTIFARDYGFNAYYGRYTKPLEEIFMKHKSVAKGKNFVQRGQQFSNFYHEYAKYAENDFSKFEGCQTPELLKDTELKIFLALYPKCYHQEIKLLFKHKLQKKIFSREGMKADLIGCRGSGDMDTGLGNTIVNLIACKYNYKRNKISGNQIVDGDDGVLFYNGISELKDYFHELGLDCKLVNRKNSTEIEFCSGKFLKINPTTFTFCQDPTKLLTSLQYYRDKTTYTLSSYYYTLGLMYLQLILTL